MINTILLLYSSTDGQTIRIAECLQGMFAQAGYQAQVAPLAQAEALHWQNFEHIIIGASVRYGKHKPEVVEFINRHANVLAAKHSAYFSVSAVARKAEKRTLTGNRYLQKFLKKIRWQPAQIGIFAGRINYALYRPLDRWVIRMIMHMTKGPTDYSANVEFTDWDDVQTFARDFCAKMPVS